MNIINSTIKEFKQKLALIKVRPAEYIITLIALISPIIAFMYGYKYLQRRFFIVATILAIVAYLLSLSLLSWGVILKLNMIFCISYLMGSYPFKIKKFWLYFCKVYCCLAMLASPLYVLSNIPEDIIAYVFSAVIIILSQYLLWCGARPEKLTKEN
jgi:hypothetical protein